VQSTAAPGHCSSIAGLLQTSKHVCASRAATVRTDVVSRVIHKVETKLFIVERIRGKLSDIKTLSREGTVQFDDGVLFSLL
jgi:hypothetical protein